MAPKRGRPAARSTAASQPRRTRAAVQASAALDTPSDEDVTGGLITESRARGKKGASDVDAYIAGGLGLRNPAEEEGGGPVSVGTGNVAVSKGDARATRGDTALPARMDAADMLHFDDEGRDSARSTAPTGRGRRAPSVVESTPQPGDTSVLALAQFKRRPRQHSLLTMVQRPDLEDSIDDGFELTLDTTLQSQSPGFAPHDESTPLPAQHSYPPLPAGQLPGFDDDDLYAVSPRPSRFRGQKRKSSEMSGAEETSAQGDAGDIEVPRTQHDALAQSSDLSDPRSSPSLPELAPASSNGSSTPRRVGSDVDIYADPLSSSPTTSPLSSPPRPVPDKRPSHARSAAAVRAPSTMDLRKLLPKRQAFTHIDTFDVSLVSDDESSDSVAVAAPKRSKKPTGHGRRALADVRTKKNASITKSSAVGKRARTRAADGKENAGAGHVRKRSGDAAAKKGSRTYGAAGRRDEDEAGSDAGSEDGRGPGISGELQAARDKFRRIDAKELEFESASLGSGSSPWR